jgi:2-polyprenyl-6-methoxyphenol hydroxylase-like FAD-dependent oxidoreductase
MGWSRVVVSTMTALAVVVSQLRMAYAFVMTQPTVLISGAGIAGPTLAYWLNRNGYRVIVVEVAPGIRPGGQTVDLRGVGREVIERMGLLDDMTALALDQAGAAWVRADGSRRAEMPVTAFDGNGLVSKVEILRGDIAEVLYTATAEHTDYRFDVRIDELEQAADGVHATLSDGSKVTAALVVGADGAHSAVRKLVWGPEQQFVKPLGGYHAWFTAQDTVGLDGWFLIYQEPGLVTSMRPDHEPRLSKAGLAFRSDPISYDRKDVDSQRRLIESKFANAGWESGPLLAAARTADDFYFDAFVQVHMDSWSCGRATLVGDAGYCASPLSGMGTALALVGAYLLAGELGPAGDGLSPPRLAEALARYENLMRPFVANVQKLPAGIDGYAPKSNADIAINGLVMKWMQRWPFRPIANRLWMSKADSIELPDYRPGEPG